MRERERERGREREREGEREREESVSVSLPPLKGSHHASRSVYPGAGGYTATIL